MNEKNTKGAPCHLQQAPVLSGRGQPKLRWKALWGQGQGHLTLPSGDGYIKRKSAALYDVNSPQRDDRGEARRLRPTERSDKRSMAHATVL
jgi:hypothetical protein